MAEIELVTEAQVMSKLRVTSRTTIRNYTEKMGFPKPIRSRPKLYILAEVDKWILNGGVNQRWASRVHAEKSCLCLHCAVHRFAFLSLLIDVISKVCDMYHSRSLLAFRSSECWDWQSVFRRLPFSGCRLHAKIFLAYLAKWNGCRLIFSHQ